jgi:hypothetical protein
MKVFENLYKKFNIKNDPGRLLGMPDLFQIREYLKLKFEVPLRDCKTD